MRFRWVECLIHLPINEYLHSLELPNRNCFDLHLNFSATLGKPHLFAWPSSRDTQIQQWTAGRKGMSRSIALRDGLHVQHLRTHVGANGANRLPSLIDREIGRRCDRWSESEIPETVKVPQFAFELIAWTLHR